MVRPPDAEVVDHVLGYLTRARWFAGKGRTVELVSMTPLPWLTEVSEFFGAPSGAPAVRFEIAEVRYPPPEDGEDDMRSDVVSDSDDAGVDHEYYQLAMSYRQAPRSELQHAEIGRLIHPQLGPVVVYDAAQDPQACRVIVGAVLSSRMLRGPDQTVRFQLTDAQGLSPELEPRVFTGQQSNTSVMLGDVAMIKLFRRLELGRNLDIEVHEALNAARSADVAGLFGWVEATWVSGGTLLAADLGMVVEMLPEAVDGWDLALASLRESGSDFSTDAEALGRSLAAIHADLRDAFPTGQTSGASVAGVMADRLARAITIAPALAPHTTGLGRCFNELAKTDLATQRVHGDFHLGQTLRNPQGWKVIDFEGEPVKTMAERLAPDSVWRDVAGMLRSFDYAAASVPEADDPLGWATDVRDAFLAGYTGGGVDDDTAAVLRAYEADKAVYEVVYETRNRPDWVNIPVRAIEAIAHDSLDNEPTNRDSPNGVTPSRTNQRSTTIHG